MKPKGKKMNRKEQIEILESHLTEGQAKYLNFEIWESLPTEEQLEDWLPEFIEEWNTPEEWVGERDDQMRHIIEKLDDITEGN